MNPSSYLWAAANRPAIGSMAVTTHFDDVATGDTSTGESSTGSTTFGAGCALQNASAYLTGVADFGQPVTLDSAWLLMCRIDHNDGDSASCPLLLDMDPPAGSALSLTLEHSLDGSSWNAFTTGSSFSVSGPYRRYVGTFDAGTVARYVRAVLHATNQTYDQSDTISATATLTDFRLTGLAASGSGSLAIPALYGEAEILFETVPAAYLWGQ